MPKFQHYLNPNYRFPFYSTLHGRLLSEHARPGDAPDRYLANPRRDRLSFSVLPVADTSWAYTWSLCTTSIQPSQRIGSFGTPTTILKRDTGRSESVASQDVIISSQMERTFGCSGVSEYGKEDTCGEMGEARQEDEVRTRT